VLRTQTKISVQNLLVRVSLSELAKEFGPPYLRLSRKGIRSGALWSVIFTNSFAFWELTL
jgi:hypothetical protein